MPPSPELLSGDPGLSSRPRELTRSAAACERRSLLARSTVRCLRHDLLNQLVVEGCVGVTLPQRSLFWQCLPFPRPQSSPCHLAALLKSSVRKACSVCDMSVRSWMGAVASWSSECVFSVCVRVCVCSKQAVACGKGKNMTLVFVSVLTAQ